MQTDYNSSSGNLIEKFENRAELFLWFHQFAPILLDTVLSPFLRYGWEWAAGKYETKGYEITDSKLKIFAKYHLPPILYALLIVAASSISGLKSPSLGEFQLDKIIHFLEYFIFALLTFRSVSHLANKALSGKALLISFLLVGLFALGDEFYQRYVPDRVSELPDLIADLLGAIMVLFLLWIRDRKRIRDSSWAIFAQELEHSWLLCVWLYIWDVYRNIEVPVI